MSKWNAALRGISLLLALCCGACDDLSQPKTYAAVRQIESQTWACWKVGQGYRGSYASFATNYNPVSFTFYIVEVKRYKDGDDDYFSFLVDAGELTGGNKRHVGRTHRFYGKYEYALRNKC